MKKKLIALLLTACMVLSMVPTAFAVDPLPTSGTWENITWTLEDGTLSISGTGKMPDVSSWANVPWRGLYPNITRVVFSEGITRIGDHCCENLCFMTEVQLPSTVTELGHSAFKACSSLTEVQLPEGLDTICSSAFEGCKALTGITLPDGLVHIYYRAFYDCTSMTSVTVPASVQEITSQVFGYYEKMLYPGMDDRTEAVLNYDFYICGEPGTAAEQYAKVNFIPFLAPGETPKPAPVFSDVPADAYYADAVAWAVEHRITTGTSDTTFGPDDPCTRGQVVTFLWRAFGEPEPTSENNPFTDVDANQFYYKAVLWAVENGITTGTSETTFSPNAPCNRGQVVTFLWRAEGKPIYVMQHSFTDVTEDDYFFDAVIWAVCEGITFGTSDTTFGPNDPCIRSQVVTFLWRDMAE